MLDRTEVSVGAYRRCVEAGECTRVPTVEDEPLVADDLPATRVTWDDAHAYCTFRRARLPTEAEWERAARGLMHQKTDKPTELVQRIYPWGMLANPHLANHGAWDYGTQFNIDTVTKRIYVVRGVGDDSDGFLDVAPVGSFRLYATPEGIVNLAGNVAEWVDDVIDVYPHEKRADSLEGTVGVPRTNPHVTKPLAGRAVERVIRGGSFLSPLALIRGAARDYSLPTTRRPDLGFRCAREAPG
jgi:formylglycine-generating enzyme required for sulfatase activity